MLIVRTKKTELAVTGGAEGSVLSRGGQPGEHVLLSDINGRGEADITSRWNT